MSHNQREVVDAKQEFYEELLTNVKHYLDPTKQKIEASKNDFEAVDNQLD